MSRFCFDVMLYFGREWEFIYNAIALVLHSGTNQSNHWRNENGTHTVAG